MQTVQRIALTIKEIAALLGCSRSNVYRLARKGTLSRIPGMNRRNMLFPTSQIQALLDTANQKKGTQNDPSKKL